MKAIVSHDHLRGGVGVTSAIRLQVTALVRRGVLDHGSLLPFLFRSNRILPERDCGDQEKVNALAEVLREFGIMFKDDDFARRTGQERSIVPCMATRAIAPVASSFSSSSFSSADSPPLVGSVEYSLLPEGFVFRLIATNVRPRQTVMFSATTADFVLHGRHTVVSVKEATETEGTVVSVTAWRKSDMDNILAALETAETFFEGLMRHRVQMPDELERMSDPPDLALVFSNATNRSSMMGEITSCGLAACPFSLPIPESVCGVVIELDDGFAAEPENLEALEALRGRLPVLVVRSFGYRPDFSARTRNSQGEVVQRIWPAMPTPELDALAGDVLGGQILRTTGREDRLIEADICSMVANAAARDALSRSVAVLPPGHHVARFPRVIQAREFEALLRCIGSPADLELAQRWFSPDGDAWWRLKPVSSVLPAFADASDPEGSVRAEMEWRRACEDLMKVLGGAAARAFQGEEHRDVRSRYLTGFDVPCLDCVDAGMAAPHMFSRDDVILIWRTEPDKKAPRAQRPAGADPAAGLLPVLQLGSLARGPQPGLPDPEARSKGQARDRELDGHGGDARDDVLARPGAHEGGLAAGDAGRGGAVRPGGDLFGHPLPQERGVQHGADGGQGKGQAHRADRAARAGGQPDHQH